MTHKDPENDSDDADDSFENHQSGICTNFLKLNINAVLKQMHSGDGESPDNQAPNTDEKSNG